jgi:hypothetical protein
MSQEFENDEYKLKGTLERYGVFSEELLTALDQHLDKILSCYLDQEKEREKPFSTAAICYLGMALRDAENGRCTLKDRIQDIIDGYRSTLTEEEK